MRLKLLQSGRAERSRAHSSLRYAQGLWWTALTFMGLSSLCPLSDAAPPPLYSPAVTLKALRHPAGALDALRYLHTLRPIDRALLAGEELFRQLDELILDERRSLQVRLWSVELLKAMGAARPSLQALIKASLTLGSPEDREGTEALILARSAALSLRALGRADLLTEALSHPDPELRGHAAASGAGPKRLCQLALTDPWPQVRGSAIRGLERVGGSEALCLREALRDQEPQLQARAAAVLGALKGESSWSPSEPQRAAVIRALRALAGTASAPLNARASALISLGRWGSHQPCDQIFKTHLGKGGIIPLALAAVEATALGTLSGEEKLKKLSPILEQSSSLEVRLSAASWIARLGAPNGARLLRRAADRAEAREARAYLKYLDRAQGVSEDQAPPAEAIDPLVPALEDEDREGL